MSRTDTELDWVDIDDDLPLIDWQSADRTVTVELLLYDGRATVGYRNEKTKVWYGWNGKLHHVIGTSNPVQAWRDI